mmetsp:Transcript_22353/g.35911  ORF Transcript_22353/g.35911 Transcript_22353/m.35911 type:complete len:432 (-) Transcript_22353:262-1557(-)
MSKRRNDRQITKDDNLDDQDEKQGSQGTSWRESAMASKEKLAKRKIVSIRRKNNPPNQAASVPSFNFGGNDKEKAPSNGFPKFNFGESSDTPVVAEKTSSLPVFNLISNADSNGAGESKTKECEDEGGVTSKKSGKTGAPSSESTTTTAPKTSGSHEKEVTAAVPKKKSASAAAAPENGSDGKEAKSGENFSFGSGEDFSFGTNNEQLDTGFKFDTSAPMFGSEKKSEEIVGFSFTAPEANTIFNTDKELSFGSFASKEENSGLTGGGDKGGKDSEWTQSFSLGGDKNEDVEESDSFKDAKPAEKGDANDDVLFKRKSKVYELSGEGDKRDWKERGKGELHINAYVVKDGVKKGRLILRNDTTKRLVLNCPVHPNMDQKLHAEKYIRFWGVNILDDPEEHSKLRTFLAKFKTNTDAKEALEKIKTLLEEAK